MGFNFLEKINFGFRNQKLPVVIQAESAECGLACLGMIARYYDYDVDLPTLRNKFSISQKGVNLRQLLDISKQMKLASRSLRLELDELNQLRLPCILHWEFSHFVVLKSVVGNKCVLHDPAVGERTVTLNEVSRSFTGVAVELWPDEGFQAKEEKQTIRWRDLIGKITGLKSSFLQVLVLALGMEVLGLISPLFTQWTIDHVIVSADRSLLMTLIMGYIIMLVTQQILSFARSWTMMYIATSLSVQWQSGVFRHLTKLPMEYFQKRHLGDVVSRFGSVDAIQSSLSSAFFVAVLDGLVTIITVVMMFIYSVKLTLICLAVMLIYIIGRILWYRPLRLASEEQIIHHAKQQSHFLETIRGIRTIKLFERQGDRSDDWLSLLVNQINSGLRVQKLQIYYQQLNGFLFGIENIIILGLGATMIMDQEFTVGVFMAFNSYKGQFSGRVSSLVDKFFELKMLTIQTERLADIVLTEPEEDPEKSKMMLAELAPSIEFRNVTFQYSIHEPMVLKGVNFLVHAGESVAFAGHSGCGKSTITQLLSASLVPAGGEILINGFNLKDLGVHNLRKISATVLQDDVLFAGSIMDNIAFFDHKNDIEWIRECARMAAIDEDIMQMPMQYNTLVGDMGLALSGGQKQRLLLARALYKRPQLLILDEATSHLDVQLEQLVNEAIKKLSITRVTVAHRPHTLAMVGRILLVNDGVIERELAPSQIFDQIDDSLKRGHAAPSEPPAPAPQRPPAQQQSALFGPPGI